MLPARPALDEVRRQRVGRPGEPDERRRAELTAQPLHRLGDEAEPGRVEVGQRVHGGQVADRRGDHRTHSGHDVEIDPERLERQHDVGEEDGRVDPVPAYGLQRDLDDQVGPHARVEHARRPPGALRYSGSDRPA